MPELSLSETADGIRDAQRLERFSWQPARSRSGGAKAVGTAEHEGQTLYGQDAVNALAAQSQTSTPEPEGGTRQKSQGPESSSSKGGAKTRDMAGIAEKVGQGDPQAREQFRGATESRSVQIVGSLAKLPPASPQDITTIHQGWGNAAQQAGIPSEIAQKIGGQLGELAQARDPSLLRKLFGGFVKGIGALGLGGAKLVLKGLGRLLGNTARQLKHDFFDFPLELLGASAQMGGAVAAHLSLLAAAGGLLASVAFLPPAVPIAAKLVFGLGAATAVRYGLPPLVRKTTSRMFGKAADHMARTAGFSPSIRYAEEDWIPLPDGPRGGKRWQHRKTGTVEHSRDNPGSKSGTREARALATGALRSIVGRKVSVSSATASAASAAGDVARERGSKIGETVAGDVAAAGVMAGLAASAASAAARATDQGVGRAEATTALALRSVGVKAGTAAKKLAAPVAKRLSAESSRLGRFIKTIGLSGLGKMIDKQFVYYDKRFQATTTAALESGFLAGKREAVQQTWSYMAAAWNGNRRRYGYVGATLIEMASLAGAMTLKKAIGVGAGALAGATLLAPAVGATAGAVGGAVAGWMAQSAAKWVLKQAFGTAIGAPVSATVRYGVGQVAKRIAKNLPAPAGAVAGYGRTRTPSKPRPATPFAEAGAPDLTELFPAIRAHIAGMLQSSGRDTQSVSRLTDDDLGELLSFATRDLVDTFPGAAAEFPLAFGPPSHRQ